MVGLNYSLYWEFRSRFRTGMVPCKQSFTSLIGLIVDYNITEVSESLLHKFECGRNYVAVCECLRREQKRGMKFTQGHNM